MRKFIIIILVLFVYVSLSAQQKNRFGHINSQDLIQAMPEFDSAQVKLQKLAKDYDAMLEEMRVELNKKLQTYQENAAQWSDLIKTTKEQELQELNQKMENFSYTAEQELGQKRVEMLRPVQEKAKKAVDAVAEENGYTYIFDSGTGAIAYSAPGTEDIMPLVKEKLGLKK